jgi:hypothetical protein
LRPTGNVLAVEARPSKPTRHASADVALDGMDGPRIIRGPYLQRVATGDAWLILDTDLPTTAELRWTSRRGSASRTLADAAGTHHALHLEHLSPATTYHYHLSARPSVDRVDLAAPLEVDADFHTPPSAGHPLRLVVWGDVRSGHDVHAQLVKAIVAEDPDLVLLTGDLVDAGTDDGDWERFFDIEAPLLKQICTYVAPGNHEYQRRHLGIERFLDYFLRPAAPSWWSVDVAGVHFALVDSEAFGDKAQLDWIAQDLAEARRRKVRGIFVVGHDGPYSSALHGDNKEAIRDYVPLFQKYRVSMVFSGHDHDYERGRVDGLDYLVSGGGGAELRTPRCGVTGKKKCGKRTFSFVNEHHYVMIEIVGNKFKLCPKRADGTLLEACPTLPLKR